MNLEKIKILSEKKKITLTDIANKIDMSYQNLNRCIRENKIQAQDLEKISSVLKVPVSYFFDEVGPGGDKILQINKNGINVNNGTVTLADCTHQLELMKKDIEGLKKEIELKDKIIEMLEKNK